MSRTYDYDIIVVGAGHAGVEAALVGARRGFSTVLLTMRQDNIGMMSCNPAIGGLAKGQVVREIDALGGEMAKVIDATGIQFRMLNKSKGPAVWAPRAQADRDLYSAELIRRVVNQPNLEVREECINDIIFDGHKVVGTLADSGNEYRAGAVILATGTFLNGLMHVGEQKIIGGRYGEASADGLSEKLNKLGLEVGRLKTGTPPRVYRDSINYDRMEEQKGDDPPPHFSFSTARIECEQVSCWMTYTSLETHRILRENLDFSPMYSGQIQSIGPRYCPSVEDKIVRFSQKERHQIFLEPEGLNTPLMYVNGFSTSMPAAIQEQALRTIPGFETVEFVRYGYAVEYDFIPPHQLTPWLEAKNIENLFLAGQINGTSGYEEAAGLGMVAGINAVQKIRGEAVFTLDRSEAFIGVMVDDLVTKSTDEPYRLFTSRSEYRLQLRQDNADERLMRYGRKFGLIDDETYARFTEKQRKIEETKAKLSTLLVIPEEINPLLKRLGSSEIDQKMPIVNLAKRPDVGFYHLHDCCGFADLDQEVTFQVDVQLKYDGYIARQAQEIRRYKQLDAKKIPGDLDYSLIKGLSYESRLKLEKVRPISVGQASRISGVTPADISVLIVYLANIHQHSNKT